MDDLTTERSFDLQATLVIDVISLFFIYMHHMFVQERLSTRHGQTYGRLVQELNGCTIGPGDTGQVNLQAWVA